MNNQTSIYTPTDPPVQNMLTVHQLMSLFDDTLYDKSPYSHLTRLVTLLNGPIGAGRFLAHSMQTMLNMNINTAYQSFVLSLAKSVYGLTLPYESTIEENNQWHTLKEWETLFTENLNYRHTFSMLMKGFNQGNTIRGIQTVIKALLNTEDIHLIPYYQPTPLVPIDWWINESPQQLLLLYPLDITPGLLAACCECAHLLLSPNVILIPHVNTLNISSTIGTSNTCGYSDSSHITGTHALTIQHPLNMSMPPAGNNTTNQPKNTIINEATQPDSLRWDPITMSITHNNQRTNIQTTNNSSNTIIPPTLFKSTPPTTSSTPTQPTLTTENIHAAY